MLFMDFTLGYSFMDLIWIRYYQKWNEKRKVIEYIPIIDGIRMKRENWRNIFLLLMKVLLYVDNGCIIVASGLAPNPAPVKSQLW